MARGPMGSGMGPGVWAPVGCRGRAPATWPSRAIRAARRDIAAPPVSHTVRRRLQSSREDRAADHVVRHDRRKCRKVRARGHEPVICANVGSEPHIGCGAGNMTPVHAPRLKDRLHNLEGLRNLTVHVAHEHRVPIRVDARGPRHKQPSAARRRDLNHAAEGASVS